MIYTIHSLCAVNCFQHKWSGCSHVQTMCNTFSTDHVQHVYHMVRRDCSATEFDSLNHIHFSFILLAETIYQWRIFCTWTDILYVTLKRIALLHSEWTCSTRFLAHRADCNKSLITCFYAIITFRRKYTIFAFKQNLPQKKNRADCNKSHITCFHAIITLEGNIHLTLNRIYHQGKTEQIVTNLTLHVFMPLLL